MAQCDRSFGYFLLVVWHSGAQCSIIATGRGRYVAQNTLGGKAIDVADLKKGARITGNTRDKLAADLK